MGNLFDGLRDQIFDVTITVMGKVATWTPSTGGPAQTSGIHFNDPDSVRRLGDIEFMPQNSTMEYRKPNFPTLKALVDANTDETVTIDGTNYYVRTVKATDDGNTLIAVLEKIV